MINNNNIIMALYIVVITDENGGKIQYVSGSNVPPTNYKRSQTLETASIFTTTDKARSAAMNEVKYPERYALVRYEVNDIKQNQAQQYE